MCRWTSNLPSRRSYNFRARNSVHVAAGLRAGRNFRIRNFDFRFRTPPARRPVERRGSRLTQTRRLRLVRRWWRGVVAVPIIIGGDGGALRKNAERRFREKPGTSCWSRRRRSASAEPVQACREWRGCEAIGAQRKRERRGIAGGRPYRIGRGTARIRKW